MPDKYLTYLARTPGARLDAHDLLVLLVRRIAETDELAASTLLGFADALLDSSHGVDSGAISTPENYGEERSDAAHYFGGVSYDIGRIHSHPFTVQD